VNKSLDLRWISKTESNNLKIFYDKICLNRDAANALINMATAARADGVSIGVTSGYRPPILQQMVWDYWNKLQPDIVELEVAKPGYSEHQLGTAIDVTSEEIKWRGVDYKFKFTKTYSWLKKNAKQFGFIFSYTDGMKVYGYNAEEWHLRYVGRCMAEEKETQGMTSLDFLLSLCRRDDPVCGIASSTLNWCGAI